MLIPKIIHQTWKNKFVPSEMKHLVKSWLRFHPHWNYVLWTDIDNRAFVKDNFGWFLYIYDNYTYDIQRADAIRYLILLKHGGIYVDLDFECLQSVEPLLESKECVFGLEPPLHCELHKVDKIISNAFMASAPDHPFMSHVIKELYIRSSSKTLRSEKTKNNYILETTGPFMLNSAFDKFSKKQLIELLPHKLLYPFTILELEAIVNDFLGVEKSKVPSESYAIHYHLGSWWRSRESTK